MAARHRRRRRSALTIRIRRWLRRQDRFTRVLAAAVVALSVLVFSLIALRLSDGSRTPKSSRRTPVVESGAKTAARRPPAARTPVAQPHREAVTPRRGPPRPAESANRVFADRSAGPRVAILIDDLGQSLSHLDQLTALDIPLSIAVIPGLPASTRTVNEATRRGIEIILHQPMEPHEAGGKDPGAGVLLNSMTAAALRSQVQASLAAVPGAVGMNNHMGSRFTENAAGLGTVMAELKEHNLFWLDSRTTPQTRGAAVARAIGVPALERDIFIDAEVDVEFIRRQLRKLVNVALSHGTALGIGHPHRETISVLRELRSELLASGVTLVPVTALLQQHSENDPGPALAASLAGGSGPDQPAPRRTAAGP